MTEQHEKNKAVVRALLVNLASQGNASPTWAYLLQTFEKVVPSLKDVAEFSSDSETRHGEFQELIVELCEEGFCQLSPISGRHLMLMHAERATVVPAEIQPADAVRLAKIRAAAGVWQSAYEQLRAGIEEGVALT